MKLEDHAQPVRSKVLGSHVAALDGVRGLAIIMVLFVHFVGNETFHNRLEYLMTKVANYGVWGVDLFFVLSGFLITGILWDTKTDRRFFKNFYVRRTLRIFPLYYGVLTLLFVVLPLIPALYPSDLREAAEHQRWVWPYGTNFYMALKGAWALPYISHFWSLAIEEHFYLVWPVIVFACSRTALLRVCVGAIVFSLVLRWVMAFSGAGDITLQTLTPCRLDALSTGGFLAVAARSEGVGHQGEGLDRLRRATRPALYALGALILVVSGWHASMQILDQVTLPLRGTLVGLFFGALLIQAVTADRTALLSRFFCSRTMRFFGKYSYGLYVFHGIIAEGLILKNTQDWAAAKLGSHTLAMVVQALVGAAASVLVSVLSYELFEKHFLRLKERFAPSKASAGVLSAKAAATIASIS